MPKGEWETYQWITHRTGKADGTYRATDFYTEFEHGLTDRLQASLYLTAARYHVANVTGFHDKDYTGFSGARLAFKYSLRDSSKGDWGLAVYVEPEYASIDKVSGDRIDEYAVETKLILQKDFLHDTLIYLANLTAEPEIAREHGETNRELAVEISQGVSLRIAANWFLGLENRWHSEFEPWQLNHWTHYAGFLGPALHYEAKRWWFTVTWLHQIIGWPRTVHDLALGDYERNEFRLKLGFDF